MSRASGVCLLRSLVEVSLGRSVAVPVHQRMPVDVWGACWVPVPVRTFASADDIQYTVQATGLAPLDRYLSLQQSAPASFVTALPTEAMRLQHQRCDVSSRYAGTRV